MRTLDGWKTAFLIRGLVKGAHWGVLGDEEDLTRVYRDRPVAGWEWGGVLAAEGFSGKWPFSKLLSRLGPRFYFNWVLLRLWRNSVRLFFYDFFLDDLWYRSFYSLSHHQNRSGIIGLIKEFDWLEQQLWLFICRSFYFFWLLFICLLFSSLSLKSFQEPLRASLFFVHTFLLYLLPIFDFPIGVQKLLSLYLSCCWWRRITTAAATITTTKNVMFYFCDLFHHF